MQNFELNETDKQEFRGDIMNIYETCPTLESEKFAIRLFQNGDCDDLLKVYSDKNALPLQYA